MQWARSEVQDLQGSVQARVNTMLEIDSETLNPSGSKLTRELYSVVGGVARGAVNPPMVTFMRELC